MKSITLSKTLLVSIGASFAILSIFALATLPQPAAALSCLNPTEMISTYATDDSYTVVLIEAGALETEGDTHDQEVVVQEVYKGELTTNATVSFSYNETWNYLCAGGPAKEGSESLYILQDNQVVQTFAVDGELAQTLLAELGEPETPTEEPVAEEPAEEERKGLMEQIIDLLQQIISLFGGSSDDIKESESVQSYIGMTTTEAAAYADSKGELFRVVELDGLLQPVTKDYREGRINAVVQNDVVTSYTVEGVETQPVEEPEESADYIGLTVDEAQALAEANGVPFRLGMIDSEPLPVTMDYRPGRITATVEDDIVIDYLVEGEVTAR